MEGNRERAFGQRSHPKEIDETPPGGACRRVLDRPVMTLPQFWFVPVANLFEETPLAEGAAYRVLVPLSRGLDSEHTALLRAGEARGAAARGAAACGATPPRPVRRGAGAASPPPKIREPMSERPPGGAD